MMYIDTDHCTGCGLCVESCPNDALRLVEGVAQLDEARCSACEACVEACPEGAILVVQESVRSEAPIAVRAEVLEAVRVTVPVPAPARPLMPVVRPPGMWPLVGAALAFVGREVVPRLTEALLDSWERRQSSPLADASSRPVATGGPGVAGDGRRLLRRQRGRR